MADILKKETGKRRPSSTSRLFYVMIFPSSLLPSSPKDKPPGKKKSKHQTSKTEDQKATTQTHLTLSHPAHAVVVRHAVGDVLHAQGTVVVRRAMNCGHACTFCGQVWGRWVVVRVGQGPVALVWLEPRWRGLSASAWWRGRMLGG